MSSIIVMITYFSLMIEFNEKINMRPIFGSIGNLKRRSIQVLRISQLKISLIKVNIKITIHQ